MKWFALFCVLKCLEVGFLYNPWFLHLVPPLHMELLSNYIIYRCVNFLSIRQSPCLFLNPHPITLTSCQSTMLEMSFSCPSLQFLPRVLPACWNWGRVRTSFFQACGRRSSRFLLYFILAHWEQTWAYSSSLEPVFSLLERIVYHLFPFIHSVKKMPYWQFSNLWWTSMELRIYIS